MVKPNLVTEKLEVKTRIDNKEIAAYKFDVDPNYIFNRHTEMFKEQGAKFIQMFKPGIKYEVERQDSVKQDIDLDSILFTSIIFIKHFEEEEE